MTPDALAAHIVEECRRLGFHRVGITPVAAAARHDRYVAWLAAGLGGEMHYLGRADHVEPRRDPRALLAGARTAVVVALAYGGRGDRGDSRPAATPASATGLAAQRADPGPRGEVAHYARGQDYHQVMKQKLAVLAAGVEKAAGRAVAARTCVDTAPILERDLAEQAGIGFIAKNTMLIAPGLGSTLLLGELLLDVVATPTTAGPERPRCGSCRACLDACPTGAFVDAQVLDARRCISYLTIELEGPIPVELRPKLGTMIFGCDVCQAVCPFNAGGVADRPPPAPELAPSAARTDPELIPLLSLGSYRYRQFVKRTALRRVRRHQLLRNVCVALGNAGDARAVPALRTALVDRHPLVRAHAAWALGKLGDLATLRRRRDEERDPLVGLEIDAALADR